MTICSKVTIRPDLRRGGGGLDTFPSGWVVAVLWGERPPTSNKFHRMNWKQRNPITKKWFEAGVKAWEKVPVQESYVSGVPLRVEVLPFYNGGMRPDVGAAEPAAKAIVDALTIRGVGFIPDDTPDWVVQVKYLQPWMEAACDGVAVGIRPDDIPFPQGAWGPGVTPLLVESVLP